MCERERERGRGETVMHSESISDSVTLTREGGEREKLRGEGEEV